MDSSRSVPAFGTAASDPQVSETSHAYNAEKFEQILVTKESSPKP